MHPRLYLLLVASILAGLTGCRSESRYPNRPILLICPWAAGGGTDTVSRQLGFYLEQELGVRLNVVNATGGAGVTGHSRGARAAPDGYTLTMMTVEINMLRWRQLTRISWEDFTPLMLVNRDAAAVFVPDAAPWQSLRELEEDVRKRPGALRGSGTALGGIWHLALAGWLTKLGLDPGDIQWVPTLGAEPSLQKLLAGDLDVVCCSLPEAGVRLADGSVRCLGVMATERVARYEDVPTFQEQGVDWVMGGWRGLGVPKGTPQPIVDRLVAALRRVVTGETTVTARDAEGEEKETRFPDFMAARGFDATWEAPLAFRESLRRTDQELGKLLTSPEFSALTVSRFQPYFFPLLVLAALVFLLVTLVLRSAHVPPRGIANFAAVVGAGVLYVLLAEELGFIVTSAGILFCLLWWLGTRLWVSVTVTVLFVPAVYQLFSGLLWVPLPRGVLGW